MEHSYSKALAELDHFSEDLQTLTADASRFRLRHLAGVLASARDSAAAMSQFRWTFGNSERNEYLRTVPTEDNVEEEGLAVGFSFWFECEQGVQTRRGIETFRVLAGSVAFVVEDLADQCQHKFTLDIQKAGGPGSQFHAQTKGNFQNVSKFLDLPRFPVPISFPTEAVSLVLHEVFPDTWARRLGGSGKARFYAGNQRGRIEHLLDRWKTEIASSNDPVGSIRRLRIA